MAEHSFLNSSFPVLLIPYCHVDPPAVSLEVPKHAATERMVFAEQQGKTSPFMDGLLAEKTTPIEQEGKMRTENGDMTYADSGDPLVDLFYELQESTTGTRLKVLLDAAWKSDADLTLKIIWNSRSIHLGKSSRKTFYRAVGWLAETHPRTLLDNLAWLVRPVVQKKAPKKDEHTQQEGDAKDVADAVDDLAIDSDFEIIDAEEEASERPTKRLKVEDPMDDFDIKYGLAHGYWKDLLNILALAANDQLRADGDLEDVLNTKVEIRSRDRDWTSGRKRARIAKRHENVTVKLANDTFYKALHMQVAKLFADQLALDLQRLQSGNKADLKRISMAAKWAPSNKGSHDEHTFIVSTIAELLHPVESVDVQGTDRALYLRHARCAYQSKTLSPLRKQLGVVERPISAKTYDQIHYDRIPSLAMKRYTQLFQKRDEERFCQYGQDVAEGKVKISGAALLPSTMVAEARQHNRVKYGHFGKPNADIKDDVVAMVADGQWNTMVQRIKDSGTMESAIAVCDVSASMTFPTFPDGSTPMDAAIGLSLVLAEVCKPPFGGAFITFDSDPKVLQVEDEGAKRTLHEKVHHLEESLWGASTNLQAVFEDLILPMAKKHKLKQEDMVKRVFVFSDMQFDHALDKREQWSSSFERIKNAYGKAGYEMPELVFWNLASSSQGSQPGIASKPVEADEPGTAMLSGYSQAMMKVFMEGGGFDEMQDPLSFEEETVTIDASGEEVKTKRAKMTPLGIVKKAVGHEAYRMLRVVD